MDLISPLFLGSNFGQRLRSFGVPFMAYLFTNGSRGMN